MKTLVIICILFSLIFNARAEMPVRFPDLSKALPEGKLIHKSDPKIMVGFWYEYAADLNFENLKKELKEFLGAGWKEEEMDPRDDEALKQVMKTQGVDMVGYATFSNPEFPDKVITLMQKKEVFEGKMRCVVSLSGLWSEK
jgi:hypothetical protein